LVHDGGLPGDCRNPPKFANHFIDNDGADIAQTMTALATINDFMMDFPLPAPSRLNAFHQAPKR
jgi:hypothetical protein